MKIFYAIIGLTLFCYLPLPEMVWSEYAWALQDLQTFLLAAAAAEHIPFEKVELKAAAFCVMSWRLAIIPMNALDIYYPYSHLLATFTFVLIASYALRCDLMLEFQTEIREGDEAHFALVPIYSTWGLIQAVVCLNRPPRYETKSVIYGGMAWVVHNGKFKKLRMTPEQAIKKGATVIPYGAPLSSDDVMKLDSLVGKSAIPGFRDCNRLFFG